MPPCSPEMNSRLCIIIFPSFAVITSLPHFSPSPFLHLSQGNVTFSCAEPVFVAMTFASPLSFLRLPGVTEPHSVGMSVGLQFRTWNKAGLLLTFDLPKQGGAVWLYLSKARLHLQVHKSGRVPLELNTGQSDLKRPNFYFLTSSLCLVKSHNVPFKNSQDRLKSFYFVV